MIRQLSTREKRFMSKVRLRRDRGLTWPEIANELGLPLTTAYQRFQRLELREMKLQQVA